MQSNPPSPLLVFNRSSSKPSTLDRDKTRWPSFLVRRVPTYVCVFGQATTGVFLFCDFGIAPNSGKELGLQMGVKVTWLCLLLPVWAVLFVQSLRSRTAYCSDAFVSCGWWSVVGVHSGSAFRLSSFFFLLPFFCCWTIFRKVLAVL